MPKKTLRILLKTCLWLLLFGLLFIFLNPESELAKLSLYNHLFPGRERLPFGESPRTSYNLSLNNLDAMLASHKINAAGAKTPDKLRVVMIGDSSTWGTLLHPQETLAGQLDSTVLQGCNGKQLEVYNLGYPTMSLAKDLLLLDMALQFEPDLIIWSTTLYAFSQEKLTTTALVENNPQRFLQIAQKAGLEADWLPQASEERWQDQSILARRRPLADLFRLQLYGFMWAATGIDQDYPSDYAPAQVDLDADNSFEGIEGALPDEMLAWDALEAGIGLAGSTPVMLINEPMLISKGANSDIRYNFYYPRKAYDAWHQTLLNKAKENEWLLLDLWDSLPAKHFTNSAVHYDPDATKMLVPQVIEYIEGTLCKVPQN